MVKDFQWSKLTCWPNFDFVFWDTVTHSQNNLTCKHVSHVYQSCVYQNFYFWTTRKKPGASCPKWQSCPPMSQNILLFLTPHINSLTLLLTFFLHNYYAKYLHFSQFIFLVGTFQKTNSHFGNFFWKKSVIEIELLKNKIVHLFGNLKLFFRIIPTKMQLGISL